MAPVPPGPIPLHTVVGARAQPERLAAQQFHLVLLDTERAGTVYPLAGEELRIGKAPDNDVVIDHPTVSRNHLVVRRQGDRFLVQDLGSTNGTFLDGAQVREAYLRPGALLEVGDVRLRFQPAGGARADRPAAEDRLGDLVGRSVPMRQIFALLERIAPTDSTLLLVGETGAGKGAAAKAIHKLSPRAAGPLVVFDCASVSDSLIESELFGHEKGAFTGAVSQRIGCLERAHGGTLFLDEIDDLALDLQPKLLRALEDREFRRLGASQRRSVRRARSSRPARRTCGRRRRRAASARTSTSGSRSSPSSLPPLRDRKEDIPLLVDAFAGEAAVGPAAREGARAVPRPHLAGQRARAAQRAGARPAHGGHPRAGRGRRCCASSPARPRPPRATRCRWSYAGPFKDCKDELVRAFEREYLTRLLGRTKGNIARAAREAELDRKHLYSLLHKYGLVQSEGD